MLPISSLNSSPYIGQIYKIKAEDENRTSVKNSVFSQNPSRQISFTSQPNNIGLRTTLNTKEEKQKYTKITEKLDKSGKKNLALLLKNGKLLNNNSNDKSTTLDNLYKIATNPRFEGLDGDNVLKETVHTIANPFIITQQFSDIPNSIKDKVVELGKNGAKAYDSTKFIERYKEKIAHPEVTFKDEITKNSVSVEHSGCCVAASIEFNLASTMPAEFARFAESLSSPKASVEKTIQSKNLANNSLDVIWLLNAFEVPHEMNDFNSAKIILAPDKNAMIRAQIQNNSKDPGERSLVDVLMQSTFMNVGSQQTYNSLTDIRKGKFNTDNKGLIEFEKTFTESIVEDKNKTSVTYQRLDENGKLIGYETDFNTIKKHILDSLNMGENVIIGYTQIDEDNIVENGHEITIIDTRIEKDGKLTFICNDTDDDVPTQIEYSEDYLLPKIHHAGLPTKVVENDVAIVDNWKEGINAYKQAKAQQNAA